MVIDLKEITRTTENFRDLLANQHARTQWTGLRDAVLGKASGSTYIVDVEDAYRRYKGEVYYTSTDGTQIGTCIDLTSDHRAGRKVRIGYPPDSTRLTVAYVIVDAQADPSTFDVGVAPHAMQHSVRNYGYRTGQYEGAVGNDIVIVDDRQIWNVNLQPWDAMIARLVHGWVTFGSTRIWYDGANLADLTDYIPVQAGFGRYVLIELDRDQAIQYTYGDVFNFHFPANPLASYVPATDANRYPIGAILLENGMMGITWANIRTGLNLHAVPDVPRILAYIDDQIARVYQTIHLLHNS